MKITIITLVLLILGAVIFYVLYWNLKDEEIYIVRS
jgi:hypothetical protein